MSAPKTMTMTTTKTTPTVNRLTLARQLNAKPRTETSSSNATTTTTTTTTAAARQKQSSLSAGVAAAAASSNNKQQLINSPSLLSSSSMSKTTSINNDQIDQLIDEKFNQLAKKISTQLRQHQYSEEFFKTLEEILIEEPATLKERASIKKKRKSQKQQQQQQQHSSLDHSINNGLGFSYQPKSLPVEVIHEEVDYNDQTTRATPKDQQRKLAPLSPMKASAGGFKKPIKIPISKSATVSETNFTNASTRPQMVRQNTTSPGLAKQANALHGTNKRNFHYNNEDFADYDDDNEEEEDEDEDDDEDDDDDDFLDSDSDQNEDEEDEEDNNNRQLVYRQLADNYLQNQRSKLISSSNNNKSKTSSDINQNSAFKSTSHQSKASKQNLSSKSIIRSNTIGNAADLRLHQQRQHHQLPANNRALLINRHASSVSPQQQMLSSLYKPSMNYSTSTLGNHRLSDDDEIIIIPTTQSPSLMSISSLENSSCAYSAHMNQDNSAPGAADGDPDEQIERFSISRTKSFWEKLSKGPNGQAKRKSASSVRSEDLSYSGAQQQQSQLAKSATRQALNNGGGGGGGLPDSNSTTTKHAPGKQQQFSYNSSSGDENNGSQRGQHYLRQQQQQQQPLQHQHQLNSVVMSSERAGPGGGRFHYSNNNNDKQQQQLSIQQQQEINRQNIFRQTR